MIVPSIDLESGRAVQLVGGAVKVIDAGDPLPIADKFGLVGEVAVIDLDAARGRGSNTPLIEALLPRARCRVGGGVRSIETARRWLDLGAHKIILGTAAEPGILKALPRDRVIAALDARNGDVVVEGWTRSTGARVADRMRELRPYVGGFLVTFVEIEGTLRGLGTDRVRPLLEAAGGVRLTVAGGVRSAEEVATLHDLGVDVQVGMALYKSELHLGDAVGAILKSDRPDGLWPTVVVDEHGVVLGLAYSNAESLRTAIDERRGVYFSRRRGLWRKGETSGDTQRLLAVDVDCDGDALRFTVEAPRGFCHTAQRGCFDTTPKAALTVAALARDLGARGAVAGSYTARLFDEPGLLEQKLVEEARELASASAEADVLHEAADVLYFTLVKLARSGIAFSKVESLLGQRARRITRRGGDAKGAVSRPEVRK